MVEIHEQLQKIQDAFESIKNSGLDEDILLAYLKDKSGMSKRDLTMILEAQNEFFQKLSKLAEKEGVK